MCADGGAAAAAQAEAVLAERDPVPPWAVGAQLGPHNAAPKPNPDA